MCILSLLGMIVHTGVHFIHLLVITKFRAWHVYGHTHFNERVNFDRAVLQCLVWATRVDFRSYLEDYGGYRLQIFTRGS